MCQCQLQAAKCQLMCVLKSAYKIASIVTSCLCFLSVGDFLPPPPPPLDDPGTLPSGSGNFPPPPPLDEGSFRAQVRSVVEVMFISHARKLMNSVIVFVAGIHLSRAHRELYDTKS